MKKTMVGLLIGLFSLNVFANTLVNALANTAINSGIEPIYHWKVTHGARKIDRLIFKDFKGDRNALAENFLSGSSSEFCSPISRIFPKYLNGYSSCVFQSRSDYQSAMYAKFKCGDGADYDMSMAFYGAGFTGKIVNTWNTPEFDYSGTTQVSIEIVGFCHKEQEKSFNGKEIKSNGFMN